MISNYILQPASGGPPGVSRVARPGPASRHPGSQAAYYIIYNKRNYYTTT